MRRDRTKVLFGIVTKGGKVLEESHSYQFLKINLDGWHGNPTIKIIG